MASRSLHNSVCSARESHWAFVGVSTAFRPPGRTPVATRIVPESRREGLYGFLRKEVQKGRQCYVVCPLVEEYLLSLYGADVYQQVLDALSAAPEQGS